MASDEIKRDIAASLQAAKSGLKTAEIERRADVIFEDLLLLVGCAQSKCKITYENAIALRGHGNAQSGLWLDEVYAHAVYPLGFPDLTLLIVNKATGQPSAGAFDARRTILSSIALDDVPAEQKRCFWFDGYEAVVGVLEPIPQGNRYGTFPMGPPAVEREIARVVDNMMNRINGAGVVQTSIGKEYINSLSRTELSALIKHLWDKQGGRCALTGTPFELRTDAEGGASHDRVSPDRIDNSLGYADNNLQLVTQFANRARGTMPVNEARSRLVQYGDVRKQQCN
jgi:hypothetical protein